MFTPDDIKDINSRGLTIEQVEKQLEYFNKGFPFVRLTAPATIDKGIIKITDDIESYFINKYKDLQNKYQLLKFVPASGAASRMFKSLYSFLDLYKGNRKLYGDFINSGGLKDITDFILRIKDFAFYEELKLVLEKDNYTIEKLINEMNYQLIIDYLLNRKGLNYGNLPKALLKFHRYNEGSRTPVEEHMYEGAFYSRNSGNVVEIHFTLSPNHVDLFNAHLKNVINYYQDLLNVKYNISYSLQKPSTDIIAVDLDNKPFRNPDGKLLFRPGGHGALIQNLNDLNTDIIFIKNIDNVVPDKQKDDTIKFKKLLAGILLDYSEQIFKFQEEFDNNFTEELFAKAKTFFESVMYYSFPNEIEDKKKFLRKILFRPIRVCGMVKNEGEPGGGPFFVKHDDGSVSLQIVESSQIDKNDKSQLEILNSSTHFNPVDIVCFVKDYKGNKYNLPDFVDDNTGFISIKSKDGKDLKAQELPGLWNGAMAYWNTIFVEVPLTTFAPVKTIMDLLRPEHQ
ncbi:MAG: DUF4301 family protein [Marinilabiliales bacterium]